MTHEALKLALEALEDIANEIYGSWTNGEKAQRIAQNLIPTIKEALAQPQQEPVAIPRFGLNPDNGMMYESKRGPWCLFKDIPPQRKPLTNNGYHCVICGRFLLADEYGVILHDDIEHSPEMTFDDEENPQ